MADTHTTPPASDDKRVLEEALAGLQGIASQFGGTCINDARARPQYARDIATVPGELRAAIDAGRISATRRRKQLPYETKSWNWHVVEAARPRARM